MKLWGSRNPGKTTLLGGQPGIFAAVSLRDFQTSRQDKVVSDRGPGTVAGAAGGLPQ